MTRGEVWRIDFPANRGYVQAGMRPAIILQNAQTTRSVPTLLVVPLTSKQSASRFPGTLLIQPDADYGLSMPSVALAFQIQSIDRKEAILHLGTVSEQVLDDLVQVLQDIII